VTQRHVSTGDYVNEGTPLFQVINLKKVWVMFEAYEKDLSWLRKNDVVTYTVEAIPGQVFSGKISHIDPFLDAKTRIANVRVEVDNSDLKLKPEMFVNGQIQPSLSNGRKELLIPKTAVLWTGKKSVVYVKVPNREDVTFLYREIILGAEAGDAYIVKEGLNEGEEIAVTGVFKIDAAAQLHGKTSMMNPPETMAPHSHNHTNGAMTGDTQTDHTGMEMHGKPDSEESSAARHENHTMQTHLKHTMFRVSGNCAMCKSTIETATTNLDGVNTADWNMETKQIEVSFNPDKVTIDDIHTAIAAAGYDTDKMTADDTVYSNLPECCKYER
jgi:Cu(I)/Ag(I) efflux system membrane fusion protein